MRLNSLYSRIALVFAAALLGFGGFFAWLSFATAKEHQHEVLQKLSQPLAAQIIANGGIVDAEGMKQASIDALFHMLMVVNPNIEVYLLDPQGRVIASSATDDPVVREQVGLAPIQRFLAGEALPIVGDNPRHAERQDIFSVAPISMDAAHGGALVGYVYIVLLNGSYRQLIEQMQHDYWLHNAGWIGGGVLLLALLAGLAAFALITRRLNRLTGEVDAFERQHFESEGISTNQDEIGRLAQAFQRLTARLAVQMAELRQQDSLRRELVANVSHDLRTPLTAMQSYLETVQRMGASLSDEQQQQYLDIAVRQSRQVAKLAQQLFELALLELNDTAAQPEPFPIAELIQDIAQKFALPAERAGVRLHANATQDVPFVYGDIGLIERAITNFTDNAIRHTPQGGEVRLEAVPTAAGVEVRVIDTGCGIAPEHLGGLFVRGSPLRNAGHRRSGGLGLLIAHRCLVLHGINVEVSSELGRGSCFRFVMSAGESSTRLI